MSGWGSGSGFYPSAGGAAAAAASFAPPPPSRSPYGASTLPQCHLDYANANVRPDYLPKNIVVRTSSEGKRAVIIGLDLTGSMGEIPKQLVNGGLATLMRELKARQDIETPELMFMGLGDVLYDPVPVQAAEFHSETEDSKRSIQQLYMGGSPGGPNGTESYTMAWHFAAYKTNPTCMMRGDKGILFTIGDELCPAGISKEDLLRFAGVSEASDISAQELLAQVRQSYEVFHLKLPGSYSRSSSPFLQWEEVLRDPQDPTKSFVIPVQDWRLIPEIIVSVIARYCGKRATSDVVASWTNPATRAVVGAAIANLSTALVVREKQDGDDATALTVVDYTASRVAVVDEIDADLAADAAQSLRLTR